MLGLSIVARYLKVSGTALMIVGPLLGLVYVILLPLVGAITIVPLMLYRAGQLLGRAVRGNFSGHL